jgi:hypothetical protein
MTGFKTTCLEFKKNFICSGAAHSENMTISDDLAGDALQAFDLVERVNPDEEDYEKSAELENLNSRNVN